MQRISVPQRPARVERFDIVLIGTVIVLAAFTIAMLANPSFQARIVAPALDLALDSVALVVTSAVALLAWVRYREQRDSYALFLSGAFLALAVANTRAVLETIGPDIHATLSAGEPGQDQLYVFTAARALAATLLIIGGVASLRGRRRSHPRTILLIPAALMVGFIAWVQVNGTALPDLVTPVMPVAGGLPGPAPSNTQIGVAVQLIGAWLFGAAAVVCRRLWQRDRAIGDAYVTFGLVLAAFAAVHGAIFASTHPGPVTSGDLFRLGFDVALLLAIEAEARSILNALRRANIALELLRESEVERAALEERSWLSRELHDGLAQDLWLAKLKVGRLTALDLSPEARTAADEVSGAIDTGLAEARQAVMALRIAAESEDTFADLMARYVDDFEDRFGLRVEFTCEGDLPAMPVRTQAELLRIAQEALANVRRHADATVVRVRAALEDGQIRLSVVDNGRGFDPSAVRANAFGLAAMRERAALIGAALEVHSEPGDGTQVLVIAPLGLASTRARVATT